MRVRDTRQAIITTNSLPCVVKWAGADLGGGDPTPPPLFLAENLLYDITFYCKRKTHQKVSKGQKYSKQSASPASLLHCTYKTSLIY